MGRWTRSTASPSTCSDSNNDVRFVPRQRDTRSDYCVGRATPLQDLEHLVDVAIRNDPRERERDELERHVDTFSDELELVEPTTLTGRFIQSLRSGGVLHPQSYWHLAWLLLVSACFVYNCVAIPLRSTFPYQTPANWESWFVCDLAVDAVYLLDLVLVKPHVIFLYDGFWVREKRLTRKHFFATWQFKMDILSLTPIDLLYLKYSKENVLFRLPRLLKIQTFWELFDHLDSMLMSPYLVRVARTLCYMMYLVHLNACGYYAFSEREGLGTNGWTFAGGAGNAYIRCFYFATKTATSVGKNPRPETEGEYLFMTCSWLMGVFVFALLIGQIRDIVATATRTRTEHRKRLDETLEHMRGLSLPDHVQRRVQSWFTFTDQHQPFDEAKILNSLPQKLKTDVAIDVHGGTLSKVHLFNKIGDQALIRDLVLKLRSVLYLPGDFICRKNEVGKEMYIVKTGQVEVLAPSNGEVLATLGEGSVFGEISLLSLAGGNRRTADVRSRGFSNLFVLSKNDLQETLVYYPDAQLILKQKAEALMLENAARERREARLRRGSSSCSLASTAGTTPPTTDSAETCSEGQVHDDGSSGPDDSARGQRPIVRIRVTAELTPPPTSPAYFRCSTDHPFGFDELLPRPASYSPASRTTPPAACSVLDPKHNTLELDDDPSSSSWMSAVDSVPVVAPGSPPQESPMPCVQVTEHDSDLTDVTCTTLTTRSSVSGRSSSSCSPCGWDRGERPSLDGEVHGRPADDDEDVDGHDGDTLSALSDLSSASLLSPLLMSPGPERRRPPCAADLQRRRVSAPTPYVTASLLDDGPAELADGALLVPRHRLSFSKPRRKPRPSACRTRSFQ